MDQCGQLKKAAIALIEIYLQLSLTALDTPTPVRYSTPPVWIARSFSTTLILRIRCHREAWADKNQGVR